MKPYLITGHPRCRTAWFAALLTAQGFPTIHEAAVAYGRKISLSDVLDEGFCGVSDPGATVVYHDELQLFDGCPTVLIRRDSAEAKAAFERWCGREVPGWGMYDVALADFEQRFKPLVVDFHRLDEFEIVDQVVRHCTGEPLNPLVWRTFDLLKIEQHRERAMKVVSRL